MSELTNPPDDCLVCNREYDMLVSVANGETATMQTQGKANTCLYSTSDEMHAFVHFSEKYL